MDDRSWNKVGTKGEKILKEEKKQVYPISPIDVYRKFPGCGSACNKPVSRSWISDASTPLLT